jgi:hypothetical protein
MKEHRRTAALLIVHTAALAFLLGFSPQGSGAESGNAARTNANTNLTRRAQSRFPKTEVKYQHGPDSQRREGVPRGRITDHQWKESRVFPGTIRHYSIYVPAQYDARQPAALMGRV